MLSILNFQANLGGHPPFRDHVKKAYVGQTANLMYRPGFKWYYLSGQTKHECLLFKMFDAKGGVAKRKCTSILIRQPRNASISVNFLTTF